MVCAKIHLPSISANPATHSYKQTPTFSGDRTLASEASKHINCERVYLFFVADIPKVASIRCIEQ